MRKVLIPIVALAFAIAFIGCSTLPFESNLGKPVSMTKIEDTPTTSFAQTTKALWLFWGLAPLSLPTVDQVAGPAVADHTGVQNLKITTKTEVLDFIVTTLANGIVTMRTVIIEGEVYD